MSKEEKDILRAKIGQLLWISNKTRPDISFDVSTLASNLNTSTVNELIYCNKITSKIHHNSFSINYKKSNRNRKIRVYTDAAYGNLKNGGSQGGYFIFLMGAKNCCNLISWQSKQLRRIAQSSLTAETIALLDGVETALYIKELYKELYAEKVTIEVFIDNQSLLDALKSSKYVNEKRLRIDIAALKEYVINKDVNNIKWIKSSEQLADILTKSTANSLSLVKVLSNGDI